MGKYFFWRFLMIFPLALIISFIAFCLLNLAPSDPAEVALRVNDIVPTEQAIALMSSELGLDKPFLYRYWDWLSNAAHLNFGQSFLTRTSVSSEIFTALPATLWLASVSLLFIVVISLLIAPLCVVTHNTLFDKTVRAMLFIFTAMPNYWLGLLLIWILAVKFDFFPASGMMTYDSVILPALAVSLGYVGTYIRLIRGTMLNQLQQPYIFYARAVGLPERVIVWKHVLPNSLHTSLIALGMSIPKLIAGTIVIENIFSWPGIGRLCVNAIFGRDYPMIQAYILIMAMLFLIFNFVADLLQQYFDPRLAR